jgi:hypothetical protein
LVELILNLVKNTRKSKESGLYSSLEYLLISRELFRIKVELLLVVLSNISIVESRIIALESKKEIIVRREIAIEFFYN